MDFQKEKQKFLNKLQNPEPVDIDKMSYQYSLFTANIKKFLPELPKEEYRNFFIQLLYQRWLGGMDQYDMNLLKNSKVINDTSFNLEKPEECSPLIFAAFHMGPYRLFNSYLFENGFKIVLIVDHTVFLSQREELLNNVKPLLKNNKNADLIILDVKDRTSLFKLKNLILDGYVMSVYLDANKGVDKASNNEFDDSFTPIKFFNNTVYVKNGIGKLSLLVNADIIPVISYRDESETPIIHFNKEVKISDFENRKTYPAESIEYIYKIFERNLKIYKAQWLDWLRIHKWFKREGQTPYINSHDVKNIFNEDRYSLFTLNGSYYLFDLYDYISFPITDELYDILKRNEISKISEDNMMKTELIQKNVII
jgi:lauroyl/myristoyl acyltransferase